MKCIPVFNIDKYKYKYNKCNFTLYKMILIITKILFMKLYQISLKMFYAKILQKILLLALEIIFKIFFLFEIMVSKIDVDLAIRIFIGSNQFIICLLYKLIILLMEFKFYS